MIQQLLARAARAHDAVAAIKQRREYEASAIARHSTRIKQLEEEKAELIKAVGVIDRCIQLVSANGIGKIEGMVTDGLRRVYNNKHVGFVVEKRETARGIQYRLLVKKGRTVGSPMDSFGGGIQNVVGFLLRLILIKRFKLAPFIALDEQFSNVSPEYQPRIAQLLKTLAGMGFTIFAVSHQPAITGGADSVYRLTVHCSKCGQDLTPEYPYDAPVPNECPMCGKALAEDAPWIPRLSKDATNEKPE